MHRLIANSSKNGQMKIQQMAFMLIAIMIFFSMVALAYFSISLAHLKDTVQNLRDEQARELVKSIASVPELAFTSGTDCSSCIDLDKALLLKDQPEYQNFWDIDYLIIEIIKPGVSGIVECNKVNYPSGNCNRITIIDKENFGAAPCSFVSLVHWDKEVEPFRYEVGKVCASGKNLDDE